LAIGTRILWGRRARLVRRLTPCNGAPRGNVCPASARVIVGARARRRRRRLLEVLLQVRRRRDGWKELDLDLLRRQQHDGDGQPPHGRRRLRGLLARHRRTRGRVVLRGHRGDVRSARRVGDAARARAPTQRRGRHGRQLARPPRRLRAVAVGRRGRRRRRDAPLRRVRAAVPRQRADRVPGPRGRRRDRAPAPLPSGGIRIHDLEDRGRRRPDSRRPAAGARRLAVPGSGRRRHRRGRRTRFLPASEREECFA